MLELQNQKLNTSAIFPFQLVILYEFFESDPV